MLNCYTPFTLFYGPHLVVQVKLSLGSVRAGHRSVGRTCQFFR